jgi:hypothetical protein
MRVLNGHDLLRGGDHEFIVNVYRLVLKRGPDEHGYRHFRDVLEADPNGRRRIIEDMVASPEARRLGDEVLIIWDEGASFGKAVEELSAEALLVLFRQKLDGLDGPARARLKPTLRECLALVRGRRRWWWFRRGRAA